MIRNLLLGVAMIALVAPVSAQTARTTSVAPTPPATQEVWQMEAIVLLPPPNLASLRALADDHTMDAVAAHLTQMGIKYLRGPTKFYPEDHPAGFIKGIRSLPAHEPFVLPGNGVIVIYDFISTSEEAVPPPPPAQ